MFGHNVVLWFFPINCASGHPVGDGVYWPTNVEVRRGSENIHNSSVKQQNQPRQSENSENRHLVDDMQSDHPHNNSEDKENIDNVQRSHMNSNSSRGKFALSYHFPRLWVLLNVYIFNSD